MSDYIATDDDLPDLFFLPAGDQGKGSVEARRESGAARAAAVLAHYPEIRIKARRRQRQEAAIKSEREISLGGNDKKVFIKLGKKCQMWDWLRGLFEAEIIGQIRAENGDAVLKFLSEMYAKFYRYSPQGVKWVTRKQYDWLQHIACQYLKVPNEQV
jgi:hypothetical protein